MSQQDYDDNGLISSYLLLTLAMPLALYRIHSLWAHRAHSRCRCKNCRPIVRPWPVSSMLSTSLLVLFVSYLLYNVLTIRMTKGQSTFDPYATLGVPEEASLPDIKRAYKRMVRMVKRKKGDIGQEGTLININKAFSVLSDPESFNQWLSTGIEKRLIIAIPSVLLHFGKSAMGTYLLLIFAICFFCYWRYSFIQYTSGSGALLRSTEKFFEKLNELGDNDKIVRAQLLLLLSRAVEFVTRSWSNDISGEKKNIESKVGIPLVSNDKGYLHLYSYLCRTGVADPRDLAYVKDSALKLIESYIKIAQFQHKTKVFTALLVLRKMFVQAVFAPEVGMLQIPGVSVQCAGRASTVKNKADMEEFTRTNVDGENLKDAQSILKMIPTVSIGNLSVFTLDTLQADSNMGSGMGQISQREAGAYKIERGAGANIHFTLKRTGGVPYVHSPFSNSGEPLNNNWLVYYTLNGEIQQPVITVDEFFDERSIEFVLSPMSRGGDARIFVVNNGYFYVDAVEAFAIKYF